MSRSLPDFEAPPVVETALGVEFVPLARWSIPHYGLLWEKIRGDYPNFAIQPPLGSQVEKFGSEARVVPPSFQVVPVSAPEVRCWFTEPSQSRLLQVQPDRFIHNWRKPKVEGARYPHYEKIRPIFEREWGRFGEFLRGESLGEPEVVQCEVTYVNHLDRGVGWESFGDLGNVVRFWTDASTQFLPRAEAMILNVSYVIPSNKGRLHVALQPAFRPDDAKEVLQLTLTARGRPVSSRTQDVLDWLDLGHEWVVRGFADFTTDAMHRLWRRTGDRE